MHLAVANMGASFSSDSARSFHPARDLPDLHGKVALVTGGKYVREFMHLLTGLSY